MFETERNKQEAENKAIIIAKTLKKLYEHLQKKGRKTMGGQNARHCSNRKWHVRCTHISIELSAVVHGEHIFPLSFYSFRSKNVMNWNYLSKKSTINTSMIDSSDIVYLFMLAYIPLSSSP